MRSSQRATRWRHHGAALLAFAILAGLAATPAASLAATDIVVDTVDQEINGDADCSLQEAIYAANLDDDTAPDPTDPGVMVTTGCAAGSGDDTIWLPPMAVFSFADPIDDVDNFVGPTVTPIIRSAITIEGQGARLERVAAGRLARAFVVGVGGALDLREVHVKGFAIQGGDGADGGGGGMGAGGAIYVVEGSLRVRWSTFEGNRADGGNGSRISEFPAGGGGGLSGHGGPASVDNDSSYGGGGGGGSRGNGAKATYLETYRFYDLGGGGGGRVTSAVSRDPGEPCGGAGATDDLALPDGAEDGSDAPCAGGGGGGGNNIQPPVDVFCGGDGGDGHYGGGGGGGGHRGDGGDGGFGGGGGGNGGDGGYGAGGGGAEFSCREPGVEHGQGGAFGGDGADGYLTDDDPAGGGGAGLGGAIFGHLADIAVSNSTFAGNVAQQGLNGGLGANDGRGAGGAIFTVAGSLTVESSTFADNGTVTVTGGGGGAIVVHDPDGTAEASLLLRNTIIASNGSSECYTRNGVDTGGSDGNIIVSNGVNSAGDVPCPGVTGSDDPGLGALAMNTPGRTPTMAIGSSSPAIDVAVGAVPADDQRGILRPQGLAADLGAYEYDGPPPPPPGAAPVTTIGLNPATPNGSNGWYTTSVGVAIAATDVDGDLAETHCVVDPPVTPTAFSDLTEVCAATSIVGDGPHAIHAASVDVAGHIESPLVSASLKIDGTKPTLAPALNVPAVVVGQTGAAVVPNATDGTSGVASSGCAPLITTTAGPQTITCTATDQAGNTATASLTVVVEYRILGFFSPTPKSKWRAGQTVPIKVALANVTGVRISDAAAGALATACRVTLHVSGAQVVAGACLKYDASVDQFQVEWKLKKTPRGAATVAVVVAYPGSTATTRLAIPVEIVK